MQRRHRRAKARRRVVERRIDHVQGGIGVAFALLLELQPRGQKSLRRTSSSALTRDARRVRPRHRAVVAAASHSRKPNCRYTTSGQADVIVAL